MAATHAKLTVLLSRDGGLVGRFREKHDRISALMRKRLPPAL